MRVFIPYYPEISGFPFGDRHYLIVFQNNNELRPTGGFISAYGILHFQKSIIPTFEIADVYGDIDEHPYLEPPYPMKELLGSPSYKGYTFRDANYSPDYQKTAQELIRMVHLTKPGLEVDGVVAVNYSFLENLLGALGPIEVNGKILTKENLFEGLEYEVNNIDQHNVEALAKRKDILKPLFNILVKKIAFSPFKLRRVSDVITHSLAAKEIQLYFQSPSLQKMLLNQRWNIQWPEKLEGDFLAINEANLGGMKSNRYIQRRVTYHVTIPPLTNEKGLHLIGDVTIDLYHYGIENIPLSGPYSGFFRTYVPRGATLIETGTHDQKDVWESDEGLFHVFGSIVHLKPGARAQLHYRYSLPLKTLQQHYELFIPKQSGTSEDHYTVIVELSPGLRIESNSFTSRENFGIYEHELNGDLALALDMLPDKIPPRVIYQGMEGQKVILIIFNEEMDGLAAKDINNYHIRDLNVQHPEKTDQLQIMDVKHEGKDIKLTVKGMTHQAEEHYEIMINNLKDTHDNMIEPNPKKVTVVQRWK